MMRVVGMIGVGLLATIGWSKVQAQVTVETVLEGLYNPCGLAIQPGTGQVFVADSGALRVLHLANGKAENVIVGFPKDVYGKGPMYDIGPLGLWFLDKDTLVVGGGGNVDDEELLRVYDLAQPWPLRAEKMVADFALPANKDLMAEGNYYGVAATKNAIFVSCNGDDTKGWVAKADVDGNKVSNFRRFIATKVATEVDAPVAVAISPRDEVVIGQMGEITVPQDSLVTIYDATTGKMKRNFPTGLHDITGLAYSPKGKWYATDFAWLDTSQGGLFELVPKREGATQILEPKKIVSLDKPTALVFAPDGTLYVTVIGTGEKNPGKLLKIAPGL